MNILNATDGYIIVSLEVFTNYCKIMKRVTQLATAFFIGLMGARAQTSSCSDVVGYVSSKNQGSVGDFHLSIGHKEKAAQTYYYSGPGKITKVRVYGSAGASSGVPLRVHVYTIDQLGRPKQKFPMLMEFSGRLTMQMDIFRSVCPVAEHLLSRISLLA